MASKVFGEQESTFDIQAMVDRVNTMQPLTKEELTNPEAELSLLGIMINSFDEIEKGLIFVNADLFSEKLNRDIYESIMKVKNDGGQPDMVTVSMGKDHDFIMRVSDACTAGTSSSNFDYFLILLSQALFVRNSSRALISFRKAILDKREDVFDLKAELERIGDKLSRGLLNLKPERNIDEDFKSALQYRDEKVTGINGLDSVLSMTPKGSFVITAARPSVGKTIFAIQSCLNLAKLGKKVLFFSFEQPRTVIIRRFLANIIGVENRELVDYRGNYHKDVPMAWDYFKSLGIIIDEGQAGNKTVGYVKSKIKHHQPDIAIIDYLTIMNGNDNVTIRERISDISTGLKEIAKYEGTTINCLAQINRGAVKESRKPRLDDLKETGKIEEDADVVIFLHNPEPLEESLCPCGLELLVSKNREGRTTTMSKDILIDRSTFRIWNVADTYPKLRYEPEIEPLPF